MTEHRQPGRFALWRARRASRPEFVRASQVRIWRIAAIAIVAIVGAAFAVIAFFIITNRISEDEACLKSVVGAQSQRSSVLAELSGRLSIADQSRQNWITLEQRIFARALSAHPLPRKTVQREFARANRGYLSADARYRRLRTLYDRASQAHPVPRLDCTAGQLRQPTPTVTATSTTTAHATATRTMHAPVRTHVIVRPGDATRTVVRTVTVPPGKHHGRR